MGVKSRSLWLQVSLIWCVECSPRQVWDRWGTVVCGFGTEVLHCKRWTQRRRHRPFTTTFSSFNTGDWVESPSSTRCPVSSLPPVTPVEGGSKDSVWTVLVHSSNDKKKGFIGTIISFIKCQTKGKWTTSPFLWPFLCLDGPNVFSDKVEWELLRKEG